MCNIDQIMHLLNENNSRENQTLGIELSRNVVCLKAFFQPYGSSFGKNVWENCAKVVVERTDDELVPYLDDMLIWTQDLNWPGAERILNRLKEFHNAEYIAHLAEKFSIVANALNDEVWQNILTELRDAHITHFSG